MLARDGLGLAFQEQNQQFLKTRWHMSCLLVAMKDASKIVRQWIQCPACSGAPGRLCSSTTMPNCCLAGNESRWHEVTCSDPQSCLPAARAQGQAPPSQHTAVLDCHTCCAPRRGLSKFWKAGSLVQPYSAALHKHFCHMRPRATHTIDQMTLPLESQALGGST